MRAIWIVPVIASILILGGIGMLAYAVSGNTTVENIGVNPDTGLIQIEVSDPDGLANVAIFPTGRLTFKILLFCAPTITTSVIPEFQASNFPATITVEDCDGRPGDVTEWAIDSAGLVTCTSGSCFVEITTDVNGNVSVDSGKTGVIVSATVTGNVQVDGGVLTITEDSIITGNVEATNGSTVTIEDGSTVQGNVIVSGKDSILVIEDNVSIDGNIETQNVDSVTITGNTVNGNIKSDNDGDVTITGNTVNGNIEIINPSGTCSESNINVSGNNSGCPTP